MITIFVGLYSSMTWLFFFLRKRSNNLTPMLQTDDRIYHGPLTRLLKQRCFFSYSCSSCDGANKICDYYLTYLRRRGRFSFLYPILLSNLECLKTVWLSKQCKHWVHNCEMYLILQLMIEAMVEGKLFFHALQLCMAPHDILGQYSICGHLSRNVS